MGWHRKIYSAEVLYTSRKEILSLMGSGSIDHFCDSATDDGQRDQFLESLGTTLSSSSQSNNFGEKLFGWTDANVTWRPKMDVTTGSYC